VKLVCKWFGCRWDGDYNPVCLRCGRDLRAECPVSGGVYLGWGRYGWVDTEQRETERG